MFAFRYLQTVDSPHFRLVSGLRNYVLWKAAFFFVFLLPVCFLFQSNIVLDRQVLAAWVADDPEAHARVLRSRLAYGILNAVGKKEVGSNQRLLGRHLLPESVRSIVDEPLHGRLRHDHVRLCDPLLPLRDLRGGLSLEHADD
jgi:hypothetical protein